MVAGRIVAIICPLLLAGGCDSTTPAVPVVADARQPKEPPARVEALGRLEPKSGLLHLGAMAGSRLATLEVAAGDEVQAEQVLAYLDTYAMRLAQRDAAAAQLGEAQAQLKAELVHSEARIREAELAVDQAQLVGLDIAAQQAQLVLLKENLELARRDLARLDGLDESSVPSQQREHQEALVRKAEVEVSAAEIALKKLQATDELQRQLAAAQLESAQLARQRIEASAPLDSLRAALALAEAQLEMSIVRAPQAGRIVKIFARVGETLGQQPVLQMADTSQMVVLAEVYETDVQWVREGQRAEVRSQALPSSVTPLVGHVASVGTTVAKNSLLALDPTQARNDARVVEVRIALDESEPAARLLNLQVEVQIDVDAGTATADAAAPAAAEIVDSARDTGA